MPNVSNVNVYAPLPPFNVTSLFVPAAMAEVVVVNFNLVNVAFKICGRIGGDKGEVAERPKAADC